MNELIYIALVKEEIYQQCVFSVLSIAHRYSSANYIIAIYTDNKSVFLPYFQNTPQIKLIELTTSQITEWTENSSCIFLSKLYAVRDSLLRNNSKSILIDCDTFFKQSPDILFDRLDDSNCIFYENEGLFTSNRNYRWAIIMQHVNSLHAVKEKYGELITEKTHMYNVGVIGITAGNIESLNESIQLTIDFSNKAEGEAYYPEQSVLSALLPRNLLPKVCPDIVHHYCYNNEKEYFNRNISNFLKSKKANDGQSAFNSYFNNLINKPYVIKKSVFSTLRSRLRATSRKIYGK